MFFLFAHIVWFDGQPSQGYYDRVSVLDTWHRLKIDDADGDGKPVTYLNGYRNRKFNWQWINWNGTTTYSITQLEVQPYSPYFSYMGRHKDIYVKDGLGAWVLQDERWERRILPPFLYNETPYRNSPIWLQSYWDWEARH